MKIVSNFHDYYDSIRAYGSDPKLLYIRQTEELKKQDPIEIGYSPPHPRGRRLDSTVKRGFIAFCGKAYPFYSLFEQKWKVVYSFDKLKDCISKSTFFDNEEKKGLLKELKEGWPWRSYLTGEEYLTEKSWNTFWKHRKIDIDDAWFRKFKAPVFAYFDNSAGYLQRRERTAYIIVNPCLKDYNFASQVDPFQAYQQIAMYVGNNLVTQMDPDPYIPDELRAQAHGFNKWSFRKKRSK
jgi:hypothetical protein